MIERIDEGKGGGAVESSPVIEGSSDTNRGFVDIWYAEIDFSHLHEGRWSLGTNAPVVASDISIGYGGKMKAEGPAVDKQANALGT